MLIKLCPKCGAENKPDKASCSGCYASLEGVPETEGKERPAAPPPQPNQDRPAAAQPLGGQAEQSATPTSNYMAPPGAPSSYGPSVNERRQPVKQGPNWGAIFLVVLLIAGGAFGGWWFFMKPASPDAVVQRMIDASKAGDYDKYKSCLCQSFLTKMAQSPQGEQAMRSAMQQQAGKNGGGKVGKTTYENNGLIAVVELTPNEGAQLQPGLTSVDIVLIKESGQWKIDLEATGRRLMKKLFPNGIPGMRHP